MRFVHFLLGMVRGTLTANPISRLARLTAVKP